MGCRHEVRWLNSSSQPARSASARLRHPQGYAQSAQRRYYRAGRPAARKRAIPIGLRQLPMLGPMLAAACLTPCELRDTQLQERFAGLLSEFVADKLPMPK